MTEPLINPTSETRLAALRRDLPQGLLLTGSVGVGLLTIARQLAGPQALVISPKDKAGADDPDGTISVAMIRQLYDATKTRQSQAKVVIVDDADRMSHGAQSAFLKLLEEPGRLIHFILTSHLPELVLPTVRSRLQTVALSPVTAEQTTAMLDAAGVHDSEKLTRLRFMANGLPAELHRLLADEIYYARRSELMTDARALLTADTYHKLLIAQKYQADRQASLRLIDSAITIARTIVSTAPQPAVVTQLDKLLTVRENLTRNFSSRLQLTNFVL